jgi:hypothetical protein
VRITANHKSRKGNYFLDSLSTEKGPRSKGKSAHWSVRARKRSSTFSVHFDGFHRSAGPGQQMGSIGCSEINEYGHTERKWKKNISCNMASTHSDTKSFEFEIDLLRRFFERYQSS